MKNEEDILKTAKVYFNDNEILSRLAGCFCDKYRSLGHWGGVVEFTALSSSDKEILSGFLGKYIRESKVRISYKKFCSAWKNTRFAAIELENFLKYYHKGSLISKQQEKLLQQKNQLAIIDELLEKHMIGAANKWLQALKNKELYLYRRELANNKKLLQLLAEALDNLPTDYERLPVFANRVSGNPHIFDVNTVEANVLLQALAFLAGTNMAIMSIDAKTEIFYRHKLLRDDILNFATVFGLCGFDDTGRIAYWYEAAKIKAPLNLPLREIVRATKIRPIAEVKNKEKYIVYVVENSGVFSAIIDYLQQSGNNQAVICLHGQLKMASWALLDRLYSSGAELYYSGDFDPEGLGIVEKIIERYGTRVKLWHFNARQYIDIVGENNDKNNVLSDERLKKLDKIKQSSLEQQVQLLQKYKQAVYQESFINDLLNDFF
ncbi:TIGR02679 domain-containing protein [Pectinatus brassicae]|uniref:Uncharacterized protein (TIGR02679 family) n=1 Tax=Pectinatus brassicae TaxID=862415 RepID=A0A840UH69_9FIRM|nr:TIGR02679 domain-containing protein [Pectinatus brassicae]MBB5337091.1 uncharacterized protein (TIGR02679 family) [Pectinatus brassicae]